MPSRSKYRPTLLLAIILLLLSAYAVFFEIPRWQKATEIEERADRLFTFSPDDVSSFTLRSLAEDIQIEKTDQGEWRMTEPLQTGADSREVDSFLSTISNLRFSRVVEERVINPAEFGLDRPRVEIILTLPNQVERLLIGDDGPFSDTIYVERDSNQRVVLTQQWIKGSLSRTPFDFRTKIVLPVRSDPIDRINLTFPGLHLELTAIEGDWQLVRPLQARGDKEAITGLTSMLENLRAIQFYDPGPDRQTIRKTFKKSLAEITLHRSGEVYPIRFYNAPEKDRVYIETEPDQPIYHVVRANMDHLQSQLFYYSDKRMMSLQKPIINGIEVLTPQENFSLKRDKEGWVMSGQEKSLLPDRIERFLEKLEQLEAYQAPETPVKNEAKVGLRPPLYEIRIDHQEGKATTVLTLGTEFKGMLYARGNTPLGIVLVNKDFLDEIPRIAELLAQEEQTTTNPNLP